MRGIVIAIQVVVTSLMAQDVATQTPQERCEILLREYKAEELAWNARYGGGRLEDPEPLLEARYRDWPAWQYAPRFLEFAEANPGDPAAVDALLWIVNQSLAVGVSDRQLIPPYTRALDLLGKGKSLDDGRVGEACRHALRYPAPWTEQFLRTLLERSRNRDVRGMACLALARMIADRRSIAVDPWFAKEGMSPFESYLRQRADAFWIAYLTTTDTKEADDEADRLFRRAIEEFGSVIYLRSATGLQRTVADIARSEWNEFRKPTVGRVAPEIDGEGADGKRFKLSDFRGKIVVLCFSSAGDPRCGETYPRLHRLLDRFKDQPIALLSVESEKEREALGKAIREGTIIWRCWWDRGIGGPIATAWGVTSMPTLFILDRDGVVRSKGIKADQLEKAVEVLLKSSDSAHR